MYSRKVLKNSIFLLLLFSTSAFADYNANMTGVVTHVLTYTGSDQIYFRLDNQPSSHPACNTDYFAIDSSIPAERRQQVLSRLLMAYATGKPINIGYDSEAGCAHSRIRVWRVG